MSDRDNSVPGDSPGDAAPRRPIERITTPLDHFLHIESASGLVLLACTALALWFANSQFADQWFAFWNESFSIAVGAFRLDYPLWYWVNDGLMTLFFFVIGLEIKRELVDGELSDRRKIVVPVAGAIGGAALPVLIFLALNRGEPGTSAWAVPMATDIAFVVGALSLLGRRIPSGLKVFVLSVAIVDDILAILVIALFYTESVSLPALVGALAGLVTIVLLNRLGVRTVSAYVVVGIVIWFFTLKSGVHPTVAGVALGLLTPANAWLGDRSLREVLRRAARAIEATTGDASMRKRERGSAIGALHFASRETISPLLRLERALHPWVGFVIMRVFALANAGVPVGGNTLTNPLALAVAGGLIFGKPLGILAASFIVVKIGWATLPERVNWSMLFAAGALAGIGFTMSLFVASLSLTSDLLLDAKGGVLLGSGVSPKLRVVRKHFAVLSTCRSGR